jgi:hypothetical protein
MFYTIFVVSPYSYLLPWHLSPTHDIIPPSIKIITDLILHEKETHIYIYASRRICHQKNAVFIDGIL